MKNLRAKRQAIPRLTFLSLHSRRRRTGGFALVVVLGILMLLVVLAVGFISSAGNARSSASGYRASVSARQLADTAVSLVQGQINLAATQGSSVAWASQPGMVRTFNNSNGNLIDAYKLYSSQEMISNALNFDADGRLTADFPPGTWAADTAIWTDLNSPVEVEGVKNYPILDPSSLSLSDNQRPEGFAITSAPGTSSSSYQQAPMPVRWLYMLKDGSLVAPTPDSSGATATIPGATGAKGEHSIVGRIAFWTDDDSCKVNINTASEGTYWDTPRVVTKAPGTTSPGDTYDIGYAQYPPAQKEFQRYIGHPATTSLSAVFPFLTKDQIYNLVPRVIGGGSNAGTSYASGTLQPDTDRLYANVDELLFQPDRDVNGDSGVAYLSKTRLEQAKFFLTARSRAPETNLFNLPRVAMWPIYKLGDTGLPENTRTTVFDRLISFCSSTGELGTSKYYPYIFQRQDADSMINDIGLTRNAQLLDYLTYLTGQQIPGFGGRFSTKYSSDRDQILTEAFDYIRSTNLQDSTLADPTKCYTDYTVPGDNQLHKLTTGHGWVVPSKRETGSSQTMGFGRAYTLSELSLVMICNAAPDDPLTPLPVDESHGSNNITGNMTNKVLNGQALVKGEKYIQAIMIPEIFSVMQGLAFMAPDMQMTISGLDSLKITDATHPLGQSLFPNITESVGFTNKGNVWEIVKIGGCPTYRYFGFGKSSPARGNLTSDTLLSSSISPADLYYFIGNPIKIDAPPTGGTMSFTGGEVVVSLYAGASGVPTAPSEDRLIQKITIKFPPQNFPVPEIVPEKVHGRGPENNATTDTAENWWAFSKTGAIAGKSGRLNMIGSRVFPYNADPGTTTSRYMPGIFIRPEYDTIRSMVPKHGDYRLIAATPEVDRSVFVEHRYYNDSTRRMAASLSGSNVSFRTQTIPGNDVGGKYITAATYNEDVVPDIPANATGSDLPEGTGDFDNGIGNAMDGAYVNKPDEGDILKTSVSAGDYTKYPYFRFFESNTDIALGTTFFSPNRQIPSSGMLGSLSTGIKAGVPWKTLLFRPQASHPAYSTTIPDHLLMDLFWMPVVEPYAISDRFSTAGKINMNYQILPFTYIERSTGMRAALKAERLAAIPTSKGPFYKGSGLKFNVNTYTSYRLPIDRKETLSQFQDKFTSGQIFKSATEICDIHIVPEGESVASMAGTFWPDHALTGDNLRERIYTTLYPRLTTKSNTFTVHFRVQPLKQVPSTTTGTFTEGKDVVLGEFRGSTTIERFIDANNPGIPDYAADTTAIPTLDPLDKFYRWRVVENRQFAP